MGRIEAELLADVAKIAHDVAVDLQVVGIVYPVNKLIEQFTHNDLPPFYGCG